MSTGVYAFWRNRYLTLLYSEWPILSGVLFIPSAAGLEISEVCDLDLSDGGGREGAWGAGWSGHIVNKLWIHRFNYLSIYWFDPFKLHKEWILSFLPRPLFKKNVPSVSVRQQTISHKCCLPYKLAANQPSVLIPLKPTMHHFNHK